MKNIPIDNLLKMPELVLKNHYFEFDGEFKNHS